MSPTRVERGRAGRLLPLLRRPAAPYSPPESRQLLFQFLAVAMSPADLQGTAALTWRYRDPTSATPNWAYVPALRRVRAVARPTAPTASSGPTRARTTAPSSTARPRTSSGRWWASEQLRIVDPTASAARCTQHWIAGGGWRTGGRTTASSASWCRAGRASRWAPLPAGLALARSGCSRACRRTSTTCTARSSSGSTTRPGRAPGTASSRGRASCSTRFR